jgi:hypothetical protein
MALVIPWLFEREYQQHRNLDYYGLPETFEAWREMASALADLLRQAEPLSGPSDNRDDRQSHYADHRIVRRRRVPSSPPTSRSQPSDRTAQSLQPHPPTPSQCLTRQSRLVGYPFSWRCLSLRIRHPEPTGSSRATPTSLFQHAAGHFRSGTGCSGPTASQTKIFAEVRTSLRGGASGGRYQRPWRGSCIDTQSASNVARRGPARIWPLHKGAARSLSDAPAQPDVSRAEPSAGTGR